MLAFPVCGGNNRHGRTTILHPDEVAEVHHFTVARKLDPLWIHLLGPLAPQVLEGCSGFLCQAGVRVALRQGC